MTILIDPNQVTLFGQTLIRPSYISVGEWQDMWAAARHILDQSDSEKVDHIENLEKELGQIKKDLESVTLELEDKNFILSAVKRAVSA